MDSRVPAVYAQLGTHSMYSQPQLPTENATPAERQQHAVNIAINQEYDLIRVRATKPYYYYREKGSGTYNRLWEQDLKNIVRDTYLQMGMLPTDKKINDTVRTVESMTEDEISHIGNRIIEVCPGLYWDYGDEHTKPQLLELPSGPCFRRLFDNVGFTSPSTISVDATKINPVYVRAVHRNTLRWLDLLDGQLPDKADMDEVEDPMLPAYIDFPFIYTWACDDHGLYMDMLKAIASCFMRNKPKKVFALSGLKRNGKSSYLALIHTLFGRGNTSSVRLNQLSDMHFTEQLKDTLVNAPDEEAEISTLKDKDKANFKSLAAHESLFTGKMFSGDADFISSDFMCFMAWNKSPKWEGDGAAACAERTIILPFRADLSKFDTAGRDFKKETFTPQMFADLIGVVTAIAAYYNDKTMTFSDTANVATESINEDADAPATYAELFGKWFKGYETEQILFNDYTKWCRANNISFKGIDTETLLYTLQQKLGYPKRTKRNVNGKQTNMYVVPHQFGDKYYLTNSQRITQLHDTVEGIHGGDDYTVGNSVVQALEDEYAQQLEGSVYGSR